MCQIFISGVLLWSVLEYSLHRWVFHLNAENGGVFICTFHFLLHGLHHKVIDLQNLLVSTTLYNSDDNIDIFNGSCKLNNDENTLVEPADNAYRRSCHVIPYKLSKTR